MSTAKPRRLIVAVLALGALALPAGAGAGPLVASAESCDAQTFSQPFLPWADPASYTLQPGGDFEPGSPKWDLTSGAGAAANNEPWLVTDEMDGRSLALTEGSAATSPSICVGIEHPDVRFFARASSSLAVLKVEVLYTDASGNPQSLTIGTVTGNTGWSPTTQMPIVANMLALLPGEKTSVAFQLTAVSGSWRVDDFYVDPLSRW
jgi:hypothetical protein